MPSPLSEFTTPGDVTARQLLDAESGLYAPPWELQQMFGLAPDVTTIRYACEAINAWCNRVTFWPHEYEERLDLPGDRNQAVLHITPIQKLLVCAGRYAYGRRDRRTLNQVNYDYLAALAVFGSPPRFTEIDVNQIEFYAPTGEVWFPTGFFLVNYSQIQIKYIAGFTDIPGRIKAAVAALSNTIGAKGVGDRVRYTAGSVSRSFATASFITDDVKQLLEPYVVRTYS